MPDTVAIKRVSTGTVIAERVQRVPLPMAARGRLFSSLVLLSSLHGYCVGGPIRKQLESVSSAIMQFL